MDESPESDIAAFAAIVVTARAAIVYFNFIVVYFIGLCVYLARLTARLDIQLRYYEGVNLPSIIENLHEERAIGK